VGTGVIEAAKEANQYAIGVDMDQSYLAEDNVITSALKRVDVAVVDVSTRIESGDLEGGTTISLGMTEDCVGIPEGHDIIGDEIYNEAVEIGEKIKSGDIKPPANESELSSFSA
jgi:basic membrane protein A